MEFGQLEQTREKQVWTPQATWKVEVSDTAALLRLCDIGMPQ